MGLSSLTSQLEDGRAEMLPYMSATKPYSFPVVIVSVLVRYLRLSTEVSKSALPVTLPFTRLSSS